MFFVNRGDLFDGFQFDDDFAFDYQIGAETFVKFQIAKNNRHGLLPDNIQAALFQFARQHDFINGF